MIERYARRRKWASTVLAAMMIDRERRQGSLTQGDRQVLLRPIGVRLGGSAFNEAQRGRSGEVG